MSTSVADRARKEGKVPSAKRSPKKLETEQPETAAEVPAQVVKKVKAAKAEKPAESSTAAPKAPKAEGKTATKRAKKAESSEQSSEAPKVAEEPKESAASTGEAAAAEVNVGGEKLSRKKKTYQQLVSELDNLNQLLEKYVSEHKDQKVPGLSKFLKDLEKGIKKARFHVQKIGKNKNTSSGQHVQSGFQKPVRISEAVSRFTGWDVNEPRARVDVTNYVCEYIKKNELQSPKDKRVILADERLRELLDYQSERDGDLTYATIQKLLAKHYTSIASAAA